MQIDNRLEIRAANLQDAEAMASLFHQTIREVNRRDYRPEQIDAWAGPTPEPAKWRARLQNKQTFVACLDGKMVGFAEFEADGHVDAVYVHHQHQGAGIASRLLERIEQEAAQTGVVRLYTEASITARPFFEARGFVVLQPQDVEFRGAMFRNYRMEKRSSA
jgi:GNAT superfamily N-acetyltransferase